MRYGVHTHTHTVQDTLHPSIRSRATTSSTVLMEIIFLPGEFDSIPMSGAGILCALVKSRFHQFENRVVGWLVGWWFREFRRERHLLVTIFLNREQHEPLRATLRRNIFQSDCSGSISDGRVIIASKIEVKKGVHVRLDYLMIHRLYGLFRAVYTAVAPLERCKCEARKGCAEARGHGDTAIATSSTLCTLISGLFDRSWVIVNYV